MSEGLEGEVAAAPRLGAFVASRTTIAYASPAWGSAIRGRIDPGNPFWAEEEIDAPGCEDSRWVRVGLGGYACLRYAEATAETPALQPPLLEGELLPFIYAKPRQDRQGNLKAEVPRYRSYRELRRGGAAPEHLVANRQYAFVERIRRSSVGHVYVDREGRAVPGKDLVIQRPSELFGRDLLADPPAPGLTAAWSVSLPAELRDRPSLGRGSRAVGGIDYHTAFDVDPEVHRGSGVRWVRIPGAGKGGVDGYADIKQIRLWDPGPPLTEVAEEELWLDVDISQQTLALRRGPETLFVTLISSGIGRHPTPRGIFRIRNKLALGKMENRDGDPDAYYVEEVPWIQYFHRRYALHTTYWHRSLGRRRSHGCINLAPRDAAYIFAQTSPTLPEGWTSGYEHAEAPGTVIRIRRDGEAIVDRRRPLTEEDDDDDANGDEEEEEEGDDDDDGDDGEDGP